MSLSKISKDCLRVVADGSQSDALLAELFTCTLQLNQLLFAEGSPIGRAKEQEHQTVGSHQKRKCLLFRELISRSEWGGKLARGNAGQVLGCKT